MNTIDFTYGISAEKPRDLRKTMSFFHMVKATKRPVKITVANGRSFSLFVTSLDEGGKRVRLGNFSDHKENRVMIPVDYIISSEQILIDDIDNAYKGQLTIKRGDLEDEGYKRSGRDFFQVIRFAHQQERAVRVYLSDNRVIEGVTTGMNEQSVGIKLVMGNKIQLFYDWVDRVVPI
ncbi:TPA: hypothetical protein ACKE3U_003813 [Klebsiella aerogenes]